MLCSVNVSTGEKQYGLGWNARLTTCILYSASMPLTPGGLIVWPGVVQISVIAAAARLIKSRTLCAQCGATVIFYLTRG